MVHCPKCWTNNEKDAKYCAKCGAILEGSPSTRAFDNMDEWGEDVGKRAEEFGRRIEGECFGLPQGGSIIGIIIGIVIILVGAESLFGWNIDFGPYLIILFGILIAAGALYQMNKSKR